VVLKDAKASRNHAPPSDGQTKGRCPAWPTRQRGDRDLPHHGRPSSMGEWADEWASQGRPQTCGATVTQNHRECKSERRGGRGALPRAALTSGRAGPPVSTASQGLLLDDFPNLLTRSPGETHALRAATPRRRTLGTHALSNLRRPVRRPWPAAPPAVPCSPPTSTAGGAGFWPSSRRAGHAGRTHPGDPFLRRLSHSHEVAKINGRWEARPPWRRHARTRLDRGGNPRPCLVGLSIPYCAAPRRIPTCFFPVARSAPTLTTMLFSADRAGTR